MLSLHIIIIIIILRHGVGCVSAVKLNPSTSDRRAGLCWRADNWHFEARDVASHGRENASMVPVPGLWRASEASRDEG
ncbi:hypothetical protein BD626DRAFT_86838 [Schizophyllum amplum]|uniref:Secreted protein n=1 Tax=Schizophyllum amplum TaxID=97359 RepID=A0A550BS16_9AGAR|nr:hypothetical protein BD626DRAFT_86838 [Auriculariopsis ampla]